MAKVTKTGTVKSYSNSGGNITIVMSYTDPPPPVEVTHKDVPKTHADDLRACKLASHPATVEYEDGDANKTVSGTRID